MRLIDSAGAHERNIEDYEDYRRVLAELFNMPTGDASRSGER